MKNSVADILLRLENADNKNKNMLENELVNFGDTAVPELVKNLSIVKGSVRGIIAMTLIRIGQPAVALLKEAAKSNKDLAWIVKYLITEINLAA
ncbi:MAG: hypothetical protein K6C94_08605 [Candidatus Gastranaerophilales bacterium]|nr:hypothetical protein [Candidatus Gastranaerophilales bacterium]